LPPFAGFAPAAAGFAAGTVPFAGAFAAGAALGVVFACGCGAGLPCAFARATGFFTAGLGAGFFAEDFFVAAGFFAAGFDAGRDFFAAGLGAGRFAAGFFALAARTTTCERASWPWAS